MSPGGREYLAGVDLSVPYMGRFTRDILAVSPLILAELANYEPPSLRKMSNGPLKRAVLPSMDSSRLKLPCFVS
jgi:hypothetical protein